MTDRLVSYRRWFNIIRSEYLEMPCLSLTLAQARRLWALDAEFARELLEELVDAGFLIRTQQGRYARARETA